MRPYSIQWTLGVQHTFASDYTFEARYLGTRGIHLPQQIQLNRQAMVPNPDRTALPTFLQRPSDAQVDALKTTLADVAAVLDIKAVTARVRLHRARRKVTIHLGDGTAAAPTLLEVQS